MATTRADETKHTCKPDLEAIPKAAEKATGLRRGEFCTNGKSRSLVLIREAIIVMGYQNGIKVRELRETLGVDPPGEQTSRGGKKKGGGFGRTDEAARGGENRYKLSAFE